MDKKDIEHFKKTLSVEKASLEKELAEVGQRDTENPGGWDASSADLEVDKADDNEVADKLEGQLAEVAAALERIEKGTYGMCEKCGKPIEKERLEANPSARISIKHGH